MKNTYHIIGTLITTEGKKIRYSQTLTKAGVGEILNRIKRRYATIAYYDEITGSLTFGGPRAIELGKACNGYIHGTIVRA